MVSRALRISTIVTAEAEAVEEEEAVVAEEVEVVMETTMTIITKVEAEVAAEVTEDIAVVAIVMTNTRVSTVAVGAVEVITSRTEVIEVDITSRIRATRTLRRITATTPTISCERGYKTSNLRETVFLVTASIHNV